MLMNLNLYMISKLFLEVKLLIFDSFTLLYKLLYSATATYYYIIFT